MLKIGELSLPSRLLIGTGKFPSPAALKEAISASKTPLVTVALRRMDHQGPHDSIVQTLQEAKVHILPNTSGVRNAKEAILAAQMAREALGTNLLKLEIHPDPKYLLPDATETLLATEELAKQGFVVLPYIPADPVLCKRLEEAGAAAVMPLGAPIGSNQGLQTRNFLRIIIENSNLPVIVDAGIGAPSHAAEAMEMGADAVLVNTAIAIAPNPAKMAEAFALAVQAGRTAYETGLPAQRTTANASSPLTQFLDNLA